ncbi:Uncharacterised protein [Yersinia pseudotuberculosis]|nr:Uncharacterised protein [Yersinia pseudotuberculosis]
MMLTTPAASQNKAFPLAGILNRLSLSELHTKHRNSPSLPVRRNLLIKLNCAEMEELANSLIRFNSDEVPESGNSLISSKSTVGVNRANSLILSRNAQSVCREIKDEQYSGSPEHYRYSGSVVIRNGCNNENQQVITSSQLSPVALVKLNQQITGKEKGGTENTALEMVPLLLHEENQRSPALDCKINQHLAEQPVRTCETFVGHRVTVSKPVQPFGSIPRCLSSFLIMRFIQAASDSSPSCRWASSIKSRSSGSSRNWNGGLPRLSFLCVDTLSTPDVVCLCVMTHYMHMNEKATPRSAGTLPRRLTTNVNVSNEAAMLNHTPTRFKFLFLAVCRSDLNSKPHRESATAHSEQDARRSLAGQFVLSFAGRLPEVTHG